VLDPSIPSCPTSSWVSAWCRPARLIQLRIKDQPSDEMRRQVREAKDVCASHGAQLIVNDYWQEAIDEGCAWVHLGQEDLLDADVEGAAPRRHPHRRQHARSRRAGEGLAVDPDYVALGRSSRPS
jgi:thiamine-phosphate pyrophosphorylase